LDVLAVIDELRVGPVRLEKRRVIMPYVVVQGRKRHATELTYRWAEDVFDPESTADINLASMIGSQVALNYGLFTRRIVFAGPFDAADRRFLADMMENTSREIYVKKFLEPNPFLVGEAAELPVVRRDHYTRAELVFDGREPVPKIGWEGREREAGRICVLSSGGKDSLLSFGLLEELGYQVHPIFGNESGRHWFTALNAFRAFSEDVPGTTRVWMNSDRVFAWMLRRLPFVRSDFAQLRSDEYPIRLWTVAVFLFGALPLVRARGIGRLVIGDEYDTTARSVHKGITHYNGLYDQSRYFDNAMSRYYARKAWGLTQFSVVRPMSEMLIEGTLAVRYPHLLEHQVSCHAASIKDGRVHPCGKCEKCRRVVAMIVANGGDPTRCGYSNEQVEECIDAFASEGAHQERSGAEHLTWVLRRQGRIGQDRKTYHAAARHDEVMKLRFDPERSPIDGIPTDLRAPLYRILLGHATGSARRAGRTWADYDVLADPTIHQPFPFEQRERPRAREAQQARSWVLGELTWPDAHARFREVDVALLPVGAIEQHGPHLPLDTDAFDAEYLATEVAKACSDPKPLVLPLIPYGVSYHHEDFAGTISIGNETLASMTYEIGMSAAHNGITKLVIINGHGGNAPALSFAAQQINRDARIFVAVDTGETSDVDVYEMAETPNDVHAGEIETSTSLAIRPELVHMDRVEKLVPEFSSRYLNFTSKRAISWYSFTKRISDSGVMGDPTKASADKGLRMWEVSIRHLVEFVEDLKHLTLDEIFQKRY